ncbi:FtsX-like permease family protein [bacterium]|nr:MAG: FtsX-like permease family protein [bacterium]
MAFSRSLFLGLLMLVGARAGFAQNAPTPKAPASPVPPPSPAVGATSTTPAAAPVDAGLQGRLQKDIAALTAFPSRVPGTQGNIAASEYVLKRFKQIGLSNVKADDYNVTAPVTRQPATLDLNGQTLPVYPVYPNQVIGSTTPEKGLSGPLVYAGMGRPSDYNGQKIEGSIVALDFNCGMNWITAADLGANAIIFLAPTGTDRAQAERKFTILPVELPRFYIQGADAEAIKIATGQSATLKSLVTWEPVTTRNILGFLPGTNPPAKGKANTVILSAYYDSMSVIPDIAPGAEAAGNMASMLELAARLKKNPPAYNILFVANGAHHMALAGVRNFLAMHAVDRDGTGGDKLKEEIATYRAFVGLDLTSRTSTVGMFAKAWFYNQMGTGSENILLNQFGALAKAIGRYAADQAATKKQNPDEFFVDGVTGKDGRTWRSYLPSQIALDSEAATLAQIPGISFATANDARLQQDTPFDTLQNMNLPNLASQVDRVDSLLRQSLTEVANGDAKSTPVLPDPSQLSKVFGFEVGRAIYRDVAKANSFLPDTPLPDEKFDPKEAKGIQAVGVAVSDRGGNPNEQKSYSGVRGLMIERANFSKPVNGQPAVAQFLFTGPRVGDPKGGGTPGYEFEAFSINRDGHIIFAPDRGSDRQRFSPGFNKAQGSLTVKDAKANQFNADVSLICFRCRAATVFDTLDQRYFTVLREMSVLDAKTDAEPVVVGYLRPAAPPGVSEIEPIGIVFSDTGQRFKLIMAQGLLGKRLVLLQSSGDPKDVGTTAFEGEGFEVADGPDANRINRISYQTANDLWTLDQQRVRLLKGFGINNERVDKLHGEAGCPSNAKGNFDCPTDSIATPNGGSLLKAKEALAAFQYDTFYSEARRAFGLESRAYPDVEATSQDVLKGIIFYLALLLPFAYFMERMLFGFPDVRKQIVGTSLVFLAVFAAIRFVHPAFELAATPFIILLAFVILALTVIVTAFLQSKFEQEIKRLKQGVHYADMGRLSALGAAVGLGIANMRRRPTRTALTCTTLILLTFTVLSFTSVTANITNFARPYGDGDKPPAYQGFLVRDAAWSAMPDRSVDSITNEIRSSKLGEPALRAWYLSRDQGEPLQLRVQNINDPSKFFYSPALLGMSAEEKTIGSPLPGTILKGRWFEPGDKDVCLLPRDILLDDATRASEKAAKQEKEGGEAAADTTATDEPTGPPLGLTLDNAVGSKIQVSGKTLEVVGVFDDRQWYGPQAKDNLRDIDNEEFSPVDYSNDQTKTSQTAQSQSSAQGNEVSVQRYEHMQANALLVLPYQTAMDMGATTRSIAVGIKDPKVAIGELNDLMNRAALGIFGATPDLNEKGEPVGPPIARLYSSVEAASYEGFASLAIPILIAAMIIANTMLGSVYERTREIGIYSSIGLAPIHIAALFIAEAIVYAVLGSISGYLIAQVTAKIITATNALPGITLNYSSSSAVLATLIVMATVLLSTLYPAWAASRLSQPDERKAELGEPMGDLWRLQFPFTVSGLQSLGMAQFLADYFDSHTDTSVGKFYTDKIYFSALSLREAVDLLNEGVPLPGSAEAKAHAQTNSNAEAGGGMLKKFPLKKMPKIDETASGGAPAPLQNAPKGGYIELDSITESPDTQVFLLHMRTWLAPFDMGVSQDTDIILLPSNEPGLYEMQLRLERRSGEIAAWKRVNREFMTELRKQLLVWRTVKPAMQHEYILRGRAHISGQTIPTEEPGAVVA